MQKTWHRCIMHERILLLISNETAARTKARTVHSTRHFVRLEEVAWFSLATSSPDQTIYSNASTGANATKNRLRYDRLEPFAEKPIDNLTSISFCTKLESNRGMSGVHHTIQFNSSRSRNCRNRIQCFNLGVLLRRG